MDIVPNSFGYIQRSVIAGLYSGSMFSFIRNCPAVSQNDYSVTFSPAMNENSCCSTSSSSICCCHILDLSNRMENTESKT